jgi:hypothetical protein
MKNKLLQCTGNQKYENSKYLIHKSFTLTFV